MEYSNMTFLLFSFDDDIDIKQFIEKGGKITNNIKYATHVVIRKINEKIDRIFNINDFIINTNMYVRLVLVSLLKTNENDDKLWEMMTIVIKSLALTDKSETDLFDSISRLCETMSNINNSFMDISYS